MQVELDSGVTLPIVNKGCETRISASGIGKQTKITECHFPYEWKGVDYASKVSSFQPNQQTDYDLANVWFQDVRSGRWLLVHRGFVRGVGPSSDGIGRMMVDAPENMTSSIPVSQRYVKPNSVDVLQDCVEYFNEHTPFDATLGSVDSIDFGGQEVRERYLGEDTANVGQGDTIGEQVGDAATDIGRVLGRFIRPDTYIDAVSGDTIQTTKSFKSNEHTLRDILDWVCETAGGNWWFEPRESELKLIYDNDDSEVTEFTSTTITGKDKVANQNLAKGGSYQASGTPAIDVITNDALSETFPQNSLTIFGKSSWSIHGIDVNPLDDNKFPAVTVCHSVLKRRAGGRTLSGQIVETDDKTLHSAEKTAKKRLRKKITSSGEGSIECYLKPGVRVGDVIKATPECSDWSPNVEFEPLEYEVVEVRHEKQAIDEGRTYITCSPKAKTSEMEVVSSEMKKK